MKHGDSAVPSMREVADSGPFLICLQVHPSAGKGVLLSDARRLACRGLRQSSSGEVSSIANWG